MRDHPSLVAELDGWIRREWPDASVEHCEDADWLLDVWELQLPDGNRPCLGVSRRCADDRSASEIRSMLERQNWKHALRAAGTGTLILTTAGMLEPLPRE